MILALDRMVVSMYTPTGLVYRANVASVLFPCESGEIEVFPDHADLFSYIKFGVALVRREQVEPVLIEGGVLTITEGSLVFVCASLIIPASVAGGLDSLEKDFAKDLGEDDARRDVVANFLSMKAKLGRG